ncbi:hypothetical protein ANI_1_1300134 [Paecilomyces variotii No. 5]|uniref:Uncharacterized protein n=1 Tax=Byssochlamys spectabilis (strain No. 5 / NBRC 109023) TaxID=1356009 RepID=V5FMM8_BYSSN|nr:hypothetical protein ANI_1_1300134 [Paecilomyces variotii No. 5]
MQEAAQMVAWVFDDKQRPSRAPGRLFHIAQNRQWIYLIFGVYGENYLEHLKHGTVTDDSTSFLTICASTAYGDGYDDDDGRY